MKLTSHQLSNLAAVLVLLTLLSLIGIMHVMLMRDLNTMEQKLKQTEKMLDDFLDKYKKRDPSI